MVIHWSLCDIKSLQVSWTLLCFLVDLNNAVVWMVFIRPVFFKSSSPFNNPSMTVPRAPITIHRNVTLMLHSFFISLARSRYLSFFFLSFNFTLWCNVTALVPTHVNFLLTIHFLTGRWSTSGSRGVTHISCHHKNTIGGQEKIKQTNKHEQCLWLTQSRRRVCNTTCMCGLTLAWVTYENSTKQLECRHLDSIFFAGPYLLCYCLRSRPNLSVVPRQLFCWLASLLSRRQLLSAPFSNQLSFASPYHFRIRRDFRSKNPLSGFAPKQTKESSAWRATHIVLQWSEFCKYSFFVDYYKFYSSGRVQVIYLYVKIPEEFMSLSPGHMLGCAYTICSFGQISFSCTITSRSPCPP